MTVHDVDVILDWARADIIRNRMIRIAGVVGISRIAPERDVVICAEAEVRINLPLTGRVDLIRFSGSFDT